MAGERKQTRNSLSLSVKLQILREIEVEKKKKTDVAQKHNIPQSSLSTIIKNSEKIHQQALHAGESSRKRARGSTYADVDEALLQWFKQARSAALPVNGPLLSEKAKTLALEFGLKDFTGSGGWIERWKARHGIKMRNICGESADVNRETMTNWLTDVMPNIISNYACKDIFNADETGLFWRLLPDKTLHFKGETCTGGKASKERITILLCCNMDGSEKMQPLVIGKAKQPRCFRGIKHLPVQYEANQKAWMTGLLFESWVRHIDKKMAGQHRQIILLLDNCGAHPPDMQGLTNTRIAFLPPNTTSMLQPCDQGIIRNFKMIYRTRLMRKYLTAYDAGTALTINLKQAVDIISVAWNDVLPATISNCWHHSGIIKSDVSSPLDTPQPATQMWEQQSLFDRKKEVLKIPLEMDFDSYADADNDVVTNAMLSDVEIVESILQAKEEEETDQVDEEVDPIVHIPHPKEVLESIQTLRLFLQCQDESKSLHRHLSDLDNIEKSVQHFSIDEKSVRRIENEAVKLPPTEFNRNCSAAPNNSLQVRRMSNDHTFLRAYVMVSESLNRPLIREAFNIIQQPPDLQGYWLFGQGLDDNTILASAKSSIHRFFLSLEMRGEPHPTSARESCITCGDLSLAHRYWSCRRIRPVIVESFTIIPPDLQSWIFRHGLEDNALGIMASAKTHIYKHFRGLELRGVQEDPPRLAEDLIKMVEPPYLLNHSAALGLSQFSARLLPLLDMRICGFHRRVKAKTSLQDYDVPIDDTTTKPLFTPQEKGRKGYMDRSDLFHGQDTTTINPEEDIHTAPQLAGYMDRSDLLHGKETTTTSVGRYCDQGAWTDLICSMDKTPPPPQLADITSTSVGRYCDQGEWTDLICSMVKTPPPLPAIRF
ncbi:TIGD4 [Cordylochernes scorpioides]|uniref:TIGD4 n=1 Tax=Cordylochernes scorpioides TaxID=51811 RepID=A0ABY6JYS9_9ARAC|nr:TIGD4 [Cordylochernes scorpioides]